MAWDQTGTKFLSQSTAGILTSDRRNIYIEPTTVAELWPEVTPFTTDLYMGRLKRVQDPIFKMFEYRSKVLDAGFTATMDGTVTLNAPAAHTGAVAQVITFTAAPSLTALPALDSDAIVGYTFELWNTTTGNLDTVGSKKNIVIVTAKGSSNKTVTVKAIYRGTDASLSDTHSYLWRCIGNSVGEGSYSRKAWHDDLETVWGVTQKFNTTIEVTDDFIEGGVVLRGFENEFNRLVKEKAKEHKLAVEKTLLYGASAFSVGTGTTGINEPKLYDADGLPIRTSKGLINEILAADKTSGDYQNIFEIDSSTYTYANFVEHTEKLFQFAPQGYKKAYCGPGIMSYWAQIATGGFFGGNNRTNISLSDMEKNKAGYNMKYLETPHGVIELIYTPALRGKYTDAMIIPSQEDLTLAEFKPLRYNTNIKTDDGYKGRKDEYYEEVGLGMNLIEKHALFYKLPA